MKSSSLIRGAGLGLRRAFIHELAATPPARIDFYEVAPENWMKIGGKPGRQFRALTERCTFLCHGLSLSLGGPAPLDEGFLKSLKPFLRQHGIHHYSEHLSYCGDDGHLYDLMPIPHTAEAVHYTAGRIRRTQEILEMRIAIENVSYYAAPGAEMDEITFLNAVLAEADCDLLLDVNNIYVNSVNHGYSAEDFLDQVAGDRIAYLHIAGHYVETSNFLVDTHGAPVIDPVWELLKRAYRRYGILPTVLERDFNIPALTELLDELDQIKSLQSLCAGEIR